MINKYKEKFMIWQLHNRKEIIIAVVAFGIGAILLQYRTLCLMNLVDLLKKNIVMVPVVASVLVGTFTGVKYIVNLTDTINANQAEIQELKTMDVENIRRDMKVLTDNVNTVIAKLERAEGTWEMAENLYEVLADKVRQMEYDIKDLNREINYQDVSWRQPG